MSSRRAPPLENGDSLSRDEFERRYEAMGGVEKAELIEGLVYMPSPVRMEQHAEPHAHVVGVMIYYRGKTPGVRVGDKGTNRLDKKNEPQPDVLLMLPPHAGGSAKLDDRGYVNGPPELIFEIAASTVSIDLHKKFDAYLRNGVREYVVWRVEDEEIDWFVLRHGQYTLQQPDADGLLKSEVFPGLWLNPQKLVRLDIPGLFSDLDAGTATPEHAALVKKLAGAAKSA